MIRDPERVERRRRVLLVLGVSATLLLAFFALPSIAHLYTDYWWFSSLGRGDVFGTVLRTRWGLGVSVALALAGLLELNFRVALRFSRGFAPLRLHDPNLATVDIGRIAPRFLRPVSVVAGILAGTTASGNWAAWLRFTNATSFGAVDPVFGRDVGFYVFTVPVLHMAQSLLSWTVVLSLILAGAVYFVRGALVWAGRLHAERTARVHMSILVACLFGLFAYDAWLDTLDLLYSTNGPVAGASYADVHAKLPMLRVEIGAAAVGAVLVLVSMTRVRLVLAVVALALYLGVNILGVRAYPSFVQRFSVEPNEATKEAPFIEYNIAASREAYGLAAVTEKELSGDVDLTLTDIQNNRQTVENIRVWDHKPLLDTFAQIQEIRTYYDFASVDNDRYVIDGKLRQVMLSPRELSSQSLPNRRWINERFTYTHGYGLTLGPVNQATEEGLPVLYVKDIPPQSSVEGLKVTRPGIYFGELSSDYVFVHTTTEEFHHPSEKGPVYLDYAGKAGVTLDSAWARLAVSLEIGSIKLLFSDELDSDSRVLLHRNVVKRVSELAPFLRIDGDPYMVLRDNGELAWVVDAYTFTNRYPYAQPSRAGLNYLRNAVKVIVDAYDGDVAFYVADDDDPILKTWRAVFPTMFASLDEMPADLRAHLRYPEELFHVQTDMFTVYHMGSAELVYSREDQWEVPAITQGDRVQRVEPYYTIMRLPEQEEAEFILMLPFTPKNKENLAAWMVARNDGEHLGELVVYRFPRDRLVFGPSQIMNRISQNPEISRRVSLWDQRGSEVLFGTLLVIPVEESLIFVCPLYIRSSGGRIPELKRIIVAHGNDIAMEPSLDAALESVFGAVAETAARPPTQEQAGPEASGAEAAPPGPGLKTEAAAAAPAPMAERGELARRAKAIFDRAEVAQRQGDWAGYGEALDELRTVLAELAKDGRGKPPAEAPPSP